MSETINDPATYDDTASDLDTPPPETEAPSPAETSEAAPAPERRPQHVPLAELMEERRARQDAERRFAEMAKQMERGNERLQELFAQLRPPQPAQQQTIPDINVDPVGHFAAKDALRERELAELKAWKQQNDQQQQGVSAQQQFVARYSHDAAQFAAQAPDFHQAYEHIKQALVNDFLQAGYTMPDAVAELQEQERKIVARAFQEGRSPSEAIYKLAKARGFAPKPPPAEARIDAMQRGQQAARTTAGGNGRGRFDGMTLESLANLPLEEFAKVPNDIKRRLMGG